MHHPDKKARLDTDGTAKPLTRIVTHIGEHEEMCVDSGTPRLVNAEYEDESGQRIPFCMGEKYDSQHVVCTTCPHESKCKQICRANLTKR
jgi:hypothetical protein